ncbi:hypothetical protein Zmor_018363 [Zophobas morio]|uniref:Uncharacterized protein n=1 Tax=Zophobas morio TaxID=2755281 RepID=A0AA38IE47_9CUCU|nr:hypothetical protein Zmor_018363 [Zophobas morio]
MSGRFPESDNIYEFQDNLFNKKDMVTENGKRWKIDRHDFLKRSGNINNINKFDAGYFGVHSRQADNMDPGLRILMETVIEAVMDAGVNPLELKGSRTGVFISVGWTEMKNTTLISIKEPQKFAITGYLKSMYAHRLSYNLKLKGPSFTVESACSSSANALHSAFKSMRNGECENAIVAACNLTLHPKTTIQYFDLGALSNDGACKVFDQNANGYVRSEACACLFLQKSKSAKRVYAKIIHAKVSCDGFKKEGITFPSSKMQAKLFTEIYQESNISFSNVSYFETHGTGTKAGDPEEVKAIHRALANKCERQLLLGSLKSNMGHAEAASGICSIIKVLIAMETGFIPPNIHLKKIKKGLEGIEQNRMRIVTETTELLDHEAVVSVNNFGFGGNICHILLQRFEKDKIERGLPRDEVPRLVCVSGRTNDAVLKMLNDVSTKNLDEEYISLLHQLYKVNFPNHRYRGYAIVSKGGVVSMSSKLLSTQRPSFHVLFGLFVNKFRTIAYDLMKFSIFKDVEARINEILMFNNVKSFQEILNSTTEPVEDVVGSICLQLIVADIFKTLQLSPTGLFGESFGKIAVAYYYNVIQLEDAVSAAIKFSKKNIPNIVDYKLQQLIGKGYENIINRSKPTLTLNISDLPHNGENNLVGENGDFNLLVLLGTLYTEGYLPQVHKLYPTIKFPVSRGTSMISPSLQWDHKRSWYTYKFSEFKSVDTEQFEYRYSLVNEEQQFLEGHVVDGRNIFPATEYLNLVWQTYAWSRKLLVTKIPVLFENCKFLKALTVPKSGYVKLLITIQKGTVCPNANQQQIDWPHLTSFSDDQLENLKQDEIYRELCLRGYSYSGLFKAIKRCNIKASIGVIKWEDNWCTFMDNMLQMKILGIDTRLLYVPVGIKKIIIDPLKHMGIVKSQDGEERLLPVYVNEDCNIIKSGGIEIHGLQVKSVFKKKMWIEPVLEKHVFVPNNLSLDLDEVLRINTQIILENTLESTFKAVEIINKFTDTNAECILGFVNKALVDLPLVIPDLTISSKTTVDESLGIKFESVTLTSESNILLYIGSKILQKSDNLQQFLTPLSKNGFILTREDINFKLEKHINEIEILTDYVTPNERIILFRKKVKIEKSKFVKISSYNFDWLPELQNFINLGNNIIVYATNQVPEGILGLINCIRRETSKNFVQCFFMMDDAPEFDPQHSFYSKQISKNLAINVYKDTSWGTYRHLRLDESPKIVCDDTYAYFKSRGDISSFEWSEGLLTKQLPLKKEQLLTSTYYSSINFKDIMASTGRITPEILDPHRLGQECLIGFEFSGIDLSGRRLAGMINAQGISSYVTCDSSLAWRIPDSWSLEDAATVSVVYSTVIYALLMVGNMKPGSTILIHSATGGIGLAALNLCLHYECDIYVTVGTQEKREYLRKNYPQIPDSHMGHSRDTSFELMIKRETKSRGVDFILNSLSEDKLHASIRCLARGGQLMEIGKYDLANDNSFNSLFMERAATYHGIFLDDIFRNVKEMKSEVVKYLREGIKSGFVKPLPRIVFNADEIEKSYKHMLAGKHIGKILIKLRNENKDNHFRTCSINKLEIMSNPRFQCGRHYTYIVIGGLGGFGLELSDWLVLRGARKLVLTSRSGIRNGYHLQRINIWISYGVEVKVSTDDVTTEAGCENLIKEASTLGSVDGIFNLAVVLKIALFENQSEENFHAALEPKAYATLHLDRVSRKLCPQLRYFVVFSSLSCGRGHVGQSNYGMANSVMERICENRKRDGLPAVAIQWGAIGEVGLLARMYEENEELVIGGTLQQKISSCLEVLDVLIKHEYPVVSSMVVAEKYHKSDNLTAVAAVAHVIGIKNMKTISQYTTFPELGMDSMMNTEIVQLLEKDFEIYVTSKDVKSLTFARLTEMEAENKSGEITCNKTQGNTNFLIEHIRNIVNSQLAAVRLKSQVGLSEEAPTVFVLPGVEGLLKPLEYLTNSLNAHVIGVQYNYKNPEKSIEESAKNALPHIEIYLSRRIPFFFIGYSFGTLVGLEIISLLEEKGYFGTLILIDGSPTYINSFVKKLFTHEKEKSDFHPAFLSKISFMIPLDLLSQNEETLLNSKDLEQGIDLLLALIPSQISDKFKLEKQAAITMYHRLNAIFNYTFKNKKIKSSVHLFKAKFAMVDDRPDYQLSEISENLAQVTTIDGDHVTILNNRDLVETVNEIVRLQ